MIVASLLWETDIVIAYANQWFPKGWCGRHEESMTLAVVGPIVASSLGEVLPWVKCGLSCTISSAVKGRGVLGWIR